MTLRSAVLNEHIIAEYQIELRAAALRIKECVFQNFFYERFARVGWRDLTVRFLFTRAASLLSMSITTPFGHHHP
jgi:hypothetical protein